MGYNEMRLFVMNNVKYFQNMYQGLSNFIDPLNQSIGQKSVELSGFGGMNMVFDPREQKSILYRMANALDKDQGMMEMFICSQTNKKRLFEMQKRALKHISSLKTQQGDISLI